MTPDPIQIIRNRIDEAYTDIFALLDEISNEDDLYSQGAKDAYGTVLQRIGELKWALDF